MTKDRLYDTSSRLALSKLDVLSVQPLDPKTKQMLEESVKQTVVLTTEASLRTAQVCFAYFACCDVVFCSTQPSWQVNKRS